MATLGDLKARVIRETNRDDLADDLADALSYAITSAIDFYSTQRWDFNEARTVDTMLSGEEYTTLPTGTRILDELYLIIGGVRYRLTKQEMDYIEGLYSVPMIGQPTDYAVFQGQVRVWPTPNRNYSVIWLTIEDQPALTDDSSSNAWTTEGYDLIAARTRYLLYRDQFRDSAGAAVAYAAEQEAYGNLKGTTNRLIGTGRMRASW